ncbi:hypothetical protein F3Y22_tig00117012pilonHSYRG00019 [Hibiscus syriacus]|uniref:Uncharacterized protein n=1 Tax=Hibiscus syriacus TaxID=106335 RepID=A0A6A2WCL8_HIBSY|nr:hypothetical protein F3Y22_tig00117012pilonHSYRG00019 [Hibiscus syriacus]
MKNSSSFRDNLECLGLEAIPKGSGDHLAGPKMPLTETICERRAIIINMTHKFPATITLDLGSVPVGSPVINGLEERPELVLFLEVEVGLIDHGERKGALVSRLEVEIWRE